MEKATRQQIREQNRSLVFRIIFQRESTSRAEIARITGLTRTTVSEIVAEMIEEGLVKEIGTGSSIGGKSPILLSLDEDSRYLIGLDLAYNSFSGAVVNLRGKIRELICLPAQDYKGEKGLQAVYAIIDQLLNTGYQPLIGIGAGTPGLVNAQAGIVVNAVNLEWRDLPLVQLLNERYRLPIVLQNDCKALAMGELIYGGANSSHENMIVVRVGHGIGAGIILNGQLFHGDGGGAGEIGHVVVVREGGLPCRCGNFGCLETVASARAVVLRAEMQARLSGHTILAEHRGAIDLDVVKRAYDSGDPLATHIVLEAGRHLGAALSSLVTALNVHRIVLTGEMTRFGAAWLEAARDSMARNALERLSQDTRLEVGRLKDHGVMLGVSALLATNPDLLFHQ